MGLFISRDEEPVTDALDRLESNIKALERNIRNQQQTSRRCKMVVTVLFLVVFVAICIWYSYCVQSWYWEYALLYTLPLVSVTILFLFIRFLLYKYYSWTLNKKKIKLNEKRAEKRNKLEEVRNTAVYSVAKNILDKYDAPGEEESSSLMP